MTAEPTPDGTATGGLTATERRLNGRAGALQRWAEIPHAARPAATQAARDARLAKLEAKVDPDGKLDPDERRQLAVQARRAHMQLIAAKSARARRLRSRPRTQGQPGGPSVDAERP